MKRLRFVVAAVAALALIPAAADAAQPVANGASSILVTTRYEIADQCQAAPDTIKFAYALSAKATVSGGAKKPSKIKISYSIRDLTAGTPKVKRRLTLKRSRGYKRISELDSYIASHTYKLMFRSVYYASNARKNIVTNDAQSFTGPSAEEVPMLGYPACIA